MAISPIVSPAKGGAVMGQPSSTTDPTVPRSHDLWRWKHEPRTAGDGESVNCYCKTDPAAERMTGDSAGGTWIAGS